MGLLYGSGMKMVGLESGLTWIMKVLGLEVGVGEGVEVVGLWLRWWWWWGFRFGVGGLWVCFELCFRLWRMWWWLLVVSSSVVSVDCV